MASLDISEWLDMMADSVTIYAATGTRNANGAMQQSSTGTSYPAYINMKNHLIVDKEGREILAKGRVIMGSTVAVGMEDIIELPVEYVPRRPPILAVNIQTDESGNHHTTLEIG